MPSPVTGGAAKESAFFTDAHFFFPPCRALAGDRWDRQGILCLLWNRSSIALAGDSCVHWGNLISGEALAGDRLDHQIRVCHIPQQNPLSQ